MEFSLFEFGPEECKKFEKIDFLLDKKGEMWYH